MVTVTLGQHEKLPTVYAQQNVQAPVATLPAGYLQTTSCAWMSVGLQEVGLQRLVASEHHVSS